MHNPDFVSEVFRHFLRANWQYVFQKFIKKMGGVKHLANENLQIDAKTKRCIKCLWIDYVKYKNQSRKVNCFIRKDDAQMIVDNYFENNER